MIPQRAIEKIIEMPENLEVTNKKSRRQIENLVL
jgi:hypothetical protein|tara:strand:+ start:204 stop:305 length:102 start_codon:yes stop_codon:yes gene_type:complete